MQLTRTLMQCFRKLLVATATKQSFYEPMKLRLLPKKNSTPMKLNRMSDRSLALAAKATQHVMPARKKLHSLWEKF